VSHPDDPRDDYDDPPPDPRPHSPRSNSAAIIILIIGGLILLMVVACGGIMAVFWARQGPNGPPPAAPVAVVNEGPDMVATRRIYDRGDLKAEILSANGDAVRNRLGAPNRIDIGPPEVWHYAGITRDPATGKIDRDAAVVFKSGRVAEVRITPAARAKDEHEAPPSSPN
jgi:hypothetical protein